MIPLGVLASRRSSGASGDLFTFIDAAEAGTAASSPTTTNMDIGTASSTRTIVVVVVLTSTTNLTRVPSSMTIGGVSATQDQSNTTGRGSVDVWRANVPTGTTADVVITWNAANSGVTFTLYTFSAPVAVSVVDAAQGDDNDGDNVITLSMSSSTTGHVIGGAAMYYATSTGSVTGATNVGIGDKRIAAHGPTTGASHDVTFTQVAASSGSNYRASVVTYQAA